MTPIIGLYNELRFWPGSSASGGANFTLNQSTDTYEVIFQALEDATITQLGYRQSGATGTPPTYKISLQGVDASGLPDGTILGGGSPASKTFAPVSGGNNLWHWQTLDNAIAVTRGQMLAMVIAHDSGTIDGSNNFSVSYTLTVTGSYAMPYGITNDNGSRTRQNSPLFGYASASKVYGQPGLTQSSAAFSSASTPDERANLITIPTEWCSQYQIVGALIYGTLAAGGALDIVLYDTDGSTVLQSISHDTDQDRNAASQNVRAIIFDESTLATLQAGSSYRLAFKPTTGSLVLPSMTMSAAADLDAYFGGQACIGSSRTDGGAWTDSNVTRYGINPIIGGVQASQAHARLALGIGM